MRYNYSKSQIFLLEFIIVILFFAICTTICVSVFIKSDIISKDSQRDISAMILAQNAAECFKVDETSLIEVSPKPSNVLPDKTVTYYDQGFNIVNKEEGVYSMTITTTENTNGILTAEISIYENNEVNAFYKLSVDKYIGEQN